MKFSIVIPVYNVEAFIAKCLDSVLSQTYDDYEVICINDGSTDNSLNILKKYAQKSHKIKIKDQENKGLSRARNVGINEAKGQYIFFLDSDDWIEKDTLKILSEKTHDEDMICFSGKLYYEDGAKEINDIALPEKEMKGWEYYNEFALQNRKFHFVCVVLRLYRKEFLLKYNLFFEEGIFHEDNLFTPIVCYYAEKVKLISDFLYVYRIRPGSITQKITDKRIEDILFVANKLSEFFIGIQNKNIEKKIIYKDIFFYYPNILILAKKNNKKALIGTIYNQINWDNYKILSNSGWEKFIYLMVKHKIPLFYYYPQFEKVFNKLKRFLHG